MRCQFCEQDVDDPCRDMQDIQERAANHIPRCGNALKSQPGAMNCAHPTEVQGDGRR